MSKRQAVNMEGTGAYREIPLSASNGVRSATTCSSSPQTRPAPSSTGRATCLEMCVTEQIPGPCRAARGRYSLLGPQLVAGAPRRTSSPCLSGDGTVSEFASLRPAKREEWPRTRKAACQDREAGSTRAELGGSGVLTWPIQSSSSSSQGVTRCEAWEDWDSCTKYILGIWSRSTYKLLK